VHPRIKIREPQNPDGGYNDKKAAGCQKKPPESTNCSPQLSQKRAASGKLKLHRGQVWTSKAPQCLQKLAPARLGVWQLGQFITSVLSPPWVDWF